jgi:hypothetical protein
VSTAFDRKPAQSLGGNGQELTGQQPLFRDPMAEGTLVRLDGPPQVKPPGAL